MDKYSFQYCQKIVVFNDDFSKILLAKRKGENDFDGVYSFIGGKMERTDLDVVDSMKREKSEEIGNECKINIFPQFSFNLSYVKNDGSPMILPHYFAQFVDGEIRLNDEYSDFQWIDVEKLNDFKPLISTIPNVVETLIKLIPILKSLKSQTI